MPIDEAARSWARFARECEHVRRYVPADHWTVLRHEDLCADPDAEISRLHRFAGLEPDDTYRDFRSATQHIIGNRMRLATSSEIKQDRAWESALTAEEQARIVSLTDARRRRIVEG